MITILDAMSNSGASEFTTATISAGATGYYLVWKGTIGSEAVGRTSIAIGGQNLSLLSEGQNTGRNVAIQLWFLDSAGIDARTDDNISYSGGVYSSSTSTQWSTADGDQAGGTAVGFVPAGNSTSIALSLARADNSITFAVGGAEDTVSSVTLTNPAQSVQYSGAGANAYGSQADSSGVSDVTMSFGFSRDLGLVAVNVGSAAAAGPTITGPDTTTEGAVTVQAGTLLDTVVTQSLVSGSYSIEQTIDSQTATTLNYVAGSGVNLCAPGSPVSGVPLEPTITAAGITPYVVQQESKT